MCGFVCRVDSRDALFDTESFSKAMMLLRHRGPDSSRQILLDETESWQAEMGSLRLRIIDLRPESDMPMVSSDSTVTLVYNGELYNTEQLRDQLRARGHIFQGTSDTECILHLYEEHRDNPEELLPKLRGMFAFAVWDKTSERFFAARDRLGIKPLVYALNDEQGLVVASEARALAVSGLVPGALDAEAARAFLRWGVLPGAESLIKGVRRLPPGSYLTYANSALSVKRWWTLPRIAPEDSLAHPDAAFRLIRSVLSDAVTAHLVSDRRTGLFLSGGTDSRVIGALAAENTSLTALTLSFPEDPEHDETSDAAAAAVALGMDHVIVPVVEDDLEDQIRSFISCLDSPSVDALNSWLVCRAASEVGLVVALTGLGADELLGSYPSFRQVPRVQRLSAPIRLLSPGIREALARIASSRQKGSRLARILESNGTSEGAYCAVRSLFSSSDFMPGVLESGFANPIVNSTVAASDTITGLEFGHFLANQLLPDTDSVSMAHSIELRVPYLDHKVIEAVRAIPAETRAALGKRLLSRAAGIEPSPTKQPFALPMDRWLRGPLHNLFRQGLLSQELPFSDLIPLRDRAEMYRQFTTGQLHWSRPWSVVVLRLWPQANLFG